MSVTAPAPSKTGAILALMLATVASGAAALVYELVWTRAASTAFGVSAYATSTVLAAFFGGLAVGGALAARRVRRLSPRAALMGCALLEVAVAGSAVGVQVVLEHARDALVVLAQAFPGHDPAALAVRFVAMAGLMAPPTILMGATFPLLAHGLAGLSHRPATMVERAYGANVLGAAIGCASTAWLLLPGIGMRASTGLAVLVDLAVGAAVFVVARRLPADEGVPSPESPAPRGALPGLERRLVGLVGLSGAAAMAAEVVWARTFRFALGEANPYRAFALTLTLVLLGMAVGALALSLRSARTHLPTERRIAAFGMVQLLLALLCVGALGAVQQTVASWLPLWLDPARTVGRLLLGACALVLGLGFPLLAAIQAEVRQEVGERVGRLYAVSTVAGVVGSLVGGFVLLPTVGARGALLVIGGTQALAGLVALRSLRGRAWLLTGLPAAAIAWGALLAPDHPGFGYPGRLLAVHDGVEATTAVVAVDPAGRHKMLLSNSIPIDGLTSSDRATVPLSLVQTPARALLVGFGTGLTATTLLRAWRRLEVDCVELDDNQAKTTPLFGTQALLEDPRFALHLEDGRQFILRQDGRYDAIIVDSWGQSVNQEFYNVDFYRDAARALTDKGVFYAKLPMGVLRSTAAVDVMLRSAAAGFPHAYVLPPGGKGVFPGIIGSRTPLELPPADSHADRLPRPYLEAYGHARASLRAIDAPLLARLRGGRLNTDDRPWFFAPSPTPLPEIDSYLMELLEGTEALP